MEYAEVGSDTQWFSAGEMRRIAQRFRPHAMAQRATNWRFALEPLRGATVTAGNELVLALEFCND
jgi:hypothetical protein